MSKMSLNTKREIFKCDECSKTFTSKFSMIRHQKTLHDNERSFKCECGKKFGTSDQRKKHYIAKHTNERPVKCERGCEKSFATVNARLYHYRIHHDKIRYKCDLCEFSFTSAGLLKNHTAKYHQYSEAVVDSSPIPRKQAKVCDSSISSENNSSLNRSDEIVLSSSESEESSDWMSFLTD